MKTKYILTREEIAEIAYQGLPRHIVDVKGEWSFRGLTFNYTFTQEEIKKTVLRHLDITEANYDVIFEGLDGYAADVEVTVSVKKEEG